jgi:hypothetical protein
MLKEVKEVPNTLNRLRESQMISSIFPKKVFVIGLYFVAGSVLISYYVTAAVVRCAQVLYTENRQHGSTILVLTKWDLSWCLILKRRKSQIKALFLDNADTDFKN